jgi:hypothetical protein
MSKAGPDEEDTTNTVRLSTRTTATNFDKLVATAKVKGWTNSKGQPNISKVLNYIIARFRVPTKKAKK